MNKENIVIVTDLTNRSIAAIKTGVEWAQTLNCGVILVHIHKGDEAERLVTIFPEFETKLKDFSDSLKASLEKKMKIQLSGFKNHDIPISSRVFYSNDIEKYIKSIETLKPKLLVVPVIETEFDSFWSGSVVEQLIRLSKAPVLIVKKEILNCESILVPFAFQGFSEKVLDVSKELSKAFKSKVSAIHILKNKKKETERFSLLNLESIVKKPAEVARAKVIRSQLETLQASESLEDLRIIDGDGHPKEVLLEEINNSKSDLVLMGSSGKRAIERLYLGSFCEYILRNSNTSMLIVKNHD